MHLAFEAPDRAAVNAFHGAALAADGTDNGAPGLRPEYGETSGLLGKLANASTKLSAGKNADAIVKLQDFRAQVRTLGQTGKLAPADAESLAAGADSAIACVDSIGT